MREILMLMSESIAIEPADIEAVLAKLRVE